MVKFKVWCNAIIISLGVMSSLVTIGVWASTLGEQPSTCIVETVTEERSYEVLDSDSGFSYTMNEKVVSEVKKNC